MRNIKKGNLLSGTNAGDEETPQFPHAESDVCAYLRTINLSTRAEIAKSVKAARDQFD